jgi:hypothetical protein
MTRTDLETAILARVTTHGADDVSITTDSRGDIVITISGPADEIDCEAAGGSWSLAIDGKRLAVIDSGMSEGHVAYRGHIVEEWAAFRITEADLARVTVYA